MARLAMLLFAAVLGCRSPAPGPAPPSPSPSPSPSPTPVHTLEFTGRVLENATGKAVAGAVVFARFASEAPHEVATTDDHGSYSFTGWSNGCHLWILADRHLVNDRSCVGNPTLRLHPAMTVRGTVLDDETGKPIAGATVQCTTRRLAAQRVVDRTDGLGAFSLDHCPRHALEVSHSAYSPHRRFFDKWGEGSQVLIELRLKRGDKIEGRVTRNDGTPVPDAIVGAFVNYGGPDATARTDAKGRFTLGPLEPARERYVRATMIGTELLSRRYPAGGEALEVVLPLETARDLRVVVQDKQGKPLQGALVLLAQSREWYQQHALVNAVTHQPHPYVQRTGADGAYTYRGLMRRRALVTVDAGDAGRSRETVSPEATETVLVLSDGFRIEMVVTDERGTRLPYRTMQASDAADARYYSSHQQGMEVFQPLAPGTYRIWPMIFDRCAFGKPVVATAHEDRTTRVKVTCPTAGRIRGKVRGSNVRVEFHPLGYSRHGTIPTTHTHSGTFELTGVAGRGTVKFSRFSSAATSESGAGNHYGRWVVTSERVVDVPPGKLLELD